VKIKAFMKPILSFKRPFKADVEVEISLSEACSSIIALGATGSGKTTGVLQPAFYSLVTQNCSGMVFDLKGDYLALARTLVPESRRINVRTTDDSLPCNLLAGMTVEVFRSFMNNLKNSGGMRRDPYWGSGAVRDSILIFRTYQIFESREPTLAEIYENLEDPKGFCNWLDECTPEYDEFPSDYLRIIRSCQTEHFSILNRGVSSLYADEDVMIGSGAEDIQKQYAWHTSVVCSHLRSFSENPVLRSKLCVPGGSDAEITRRIYEESAVVVVHIPTTQFAEAAYAACSVLRERFYTDVLLTTKSYRHRHGVGDGRYTFLMTDEYQNFIKVNTGNNHTGLIDDNTWFDKSRAYNHINVLATQGITSLYSQVGVLATDSLLQNVRNKIYFPTDDPSTLNRVQASGGSIAVNALICPSDEGHCYIHKASRNPSFGPALSGQSSHGFMNAFIQNPVEPSAEVLSVIDHNMAQNPKSADNSDHNLRRKLVLVCSDESESEFQELLMDSLQSLHNRKFDVQQVTRNLSIHCVPEFEKSEKTMSSILAFLKVVIAKNPDSAIFFDYSMIRAVTLRYLPPTVLDEEMRNSFMKELAAQCRKNNTVICLDDDDADNKNWFYRTPMGMDSYRVRYPGINSLLRAYTKYSYHLSEEN
jgi:hypothetical protein